MRESKYEYWDKHIETLPRDELKKIQLQRLKEILLKVYYNVDFYHRMFHKFGLKPEDIKDINDLKKLPFTTKDDLRNNYPYGLLAVPKDELVEVHMTSGTTGIPTPNFLTIKDIEIWSELIARSLFMGGLRKTDIFQITPSFSLFTGGFSFFYGARKIGSFIIPTGPGNTKRQIELMKELGTTAFSSTVSYAIRLTEVAREMGIDPKEKLSVRKIYMGSEISTSELKQRLSEIWGADVYDAYGQTETYGGPSVGMDCPIHDGIHVWEDHFIIEIIDPNTGEIIEDPEEKGELVITTLTKDALPLIRYRTRDLTFIYDDRVHECGRTHRRIGSIIGRSDDAIKYHGVLFWPSYIESLLLRYRELSENYQIELFTKDYIDQMIIKIEPRVKIDNSQKYRLERLIEEELRKNFFFSAKVEIVDPNTLPRYETGKAKRVIDMREKKL